MRLDSQENVNKWLNGEYKHEYGSTEDYYKEWERMFKLGFIKSFLIYSFIMSLGIFYHLGFNYEKHIENLTDDLILWAIILPLTQLGIVWLYIKPKYLKYKSENPESKLI